MSDLADALDLPPELLAFHFNAANVHFTNTQPRQASHYILHTREHEMENRKQTPQTDEISSQPSIRAAKLVLTALDLMRS